MIQYSKRGRNADFGSLGQAEDFDSPEHKNTYAKEKKGGGLSDLVGGVTQAAGLLGGGGAGELCGCANKDKEAENAKKKELAAKYPLRDCGASPTAECLAYNKKMMQLQEEEFKMWQDSKDAQVGEALPPSAQQRFAFVARLAQKLKAKHPEAGNMTLSEIYKWYPDDFDAAYKELQQEFPFLKNIDAQTALAMNPGVANMTLDELIRKTSAISGMGSAPSGGGVSTGTAVGIGALVLGGAALFAFLRRK